MMMTSDLPPRSWPMQVLQALATMPATKAEIAEALGASPSTVDRAMAALIKGKMIEPFAKLRLGDPWRPPTYWDTTDRVKRGDA